MTSLICIVGGDPAGIAPQLIAESLAGIFSQAAFDKSKAPSFLYFSTAGKRHNEEIQRLCAKVSFPCWELFPCLPLGAQEREKLDAAKQGAFFLYDICSQRHPLSKMREQPYIEIAPGEPSQESGRLAFRALQEACNFAELYGIKAMVTAPLSKEWVIRSGEKDFCGHTEYLSKRFGCETLMLMHGKELSVIPLSGHIPLRRAPQVLKQNVKKTSLLYILKQVQNMDASYKERPWALCALNPHAGEGGLIGKEELWLRKWRRELCAYGLLVEGPLSADAIFMQDNLRKYRLVLGCYHDQVLIPFKALEAYRGINCTIGLPFLRTSPAHGTAYALALASSQSREKVDAQSMTAALDVAIQDCLAS